MWPLAAGSPPSVGTPRLSTAVVSLEDGNVAVGYRVRVDADGNLWLGATEYGAEVEVAAISADGLRVLTVLEVGRARVFDAAGELLCDIAPESPLVGSEWGGGRFEVFIESAALSRDGEHALLGLNDGTAAVYRVRDGERLAVLHPPDEEPARRWGVIRAARYSPDGTLAIVGFPGRRVGVWSADGRERVGVYGAPLGERLVGEPFVRDTLVSSVAMSPDNRAVFAGAADKTAAVFDVATGDLVFEARDHAERALAVFDGEAGLGWATTAGSVWRSAAGEPPRKVLETGEHWAEVVFDGARLLARCHDGAIVEWTLDGQRTAHHAPVDDDDRGFWADHARTLALDGAYHHWPEGGKRLALPGAAIERAHQLVTATRAPGGDLLGVAGWRDALELWDARTGALARELACPGSVGCFAFSPDGALVALGEIGDGGGRYERRVYVYEVATGRLLRELSDHDWQIRAVCFSADGALLASLGDDAVVRDLSRPGAPIARVPVDRAVGAIGFAGDELVILDEGVVRVLSGGVERIAFAAPVGYRCRWAISDDGRYLSIAGVQAITRFDLADGAVDQTAAAPIARPDSVPGALLWHTEAGSFLHQLDGPRGWIEPLELSAGGLVAVPGEAGAAVLRVLDGAVEHVCDVPFAGKLRAGRVAGDAIVLVNHEGRVYRSPLRVE